jgi:hypothetical protein
LQVSLFLAFADASDEVSIVTIEIVHIIKEVVFLLVARTNDQS